MHPQFLVLTVGAMLLGVAVLFFTITRLVGLLRKSVVARLPVVAEQIVGFEQPGTFILHVQHARLSTALWHAQFLLQDAASARDVRSWPILFRTTSSGFSTVRTSVRGFAVERPGRHKLSITGIAPGRDTSHDAIIFTRPYGAALVLLILGIVLGGFCFIGGLVFTALQLVGK